MFVYFQFLHYISLFPSVLLHFSSPPHHHSLISTNHATPHCTILFKPPPPAPHSVRTTIIYLSPCSSRIFSCLVVWTQTHTIKHNKFYVTQNCLTHSRPALWILCHLCEQLYKFLVFQTINTLEQTRYVILRQLKLLQIVKIKNTTVAPVCTDDVCVFVFLLVFSY
jgi:hypothetical protein